MENVILNSEQKDQVISLAWKVIAWLGAVLTAIGGFLFHRVESSFKKIDGKLALHEQQLIELKVSNAAILATLEPLKKIGEDVHAIKNSHTIGAHVLDELDKVRKMIKTTRKRIKNERK